MKRAGCFLLFLCVAAAVVPAFAETDITLFGAAQHQGKLSLESGASAASTLSTFNPGTFGVAGIRFGHGGVLGGDHTFAYTPKFLGSDSKAIIYNSNFLVQAPLPKIKPYGTAGLGAIFTWANNESGLPALADIGTKFAFNYGGGIKVLPAGPIGLRFDIRGYLVPDVKFNLPSASNPTGIVKSSAETLNIFEAGAGVIFSFGK